MAVAAIAVMPASDEPPAGAVMAVAGAVVSEEPVSSCAGTLTMKASSRLLPTLLVQMKYCPVTSMFPLGIFE